MERFEFKHVIAVVTAIIALTYIVMASSPGAKAEDSSQNWPNRTIHIRVGAPPGGTSDIVARIIAQKLNESLKVPVIVENRGGVVGSLDAAMLAKSAPDDHVFMLVPPGVLSINQFVYDPVGYEPETDFVSVGLVGQIPNALAVNTSMPIKSLSELIALAKAKPDFLSYSSNGLGASGQLLTELLKMQAGIRMVHVPYKGNGPALLALLANEVQVNIDNNPQLLAMIKSGKLRALAVSSAQRWTELPDVPTFAELGYPELTAQVWYGLIAQSKIPRAVVVRMNKELDAVLNQPETIARLQQLNFEVTPGTPEAMEQLVRAERERWKKVVETLPLKRN
jgi:tripartite-type tricarboxylate transporter receptor subunit TctC